MNSLWRKQLSPHKGQNIVPLRCPFNYIQWNSSIVNTLGEQTFGRYIGVAFTFIEGLFNLNKLFIWDLGSWPLYRGGLYSGVGV